MSDGTSETTSPAGPRLRGYGIAIGALILLVAGIIVGTRLQPVTAPAGTAAAPAPKTATPTKPARAPATPLGAPPLAELAAAFKAVTGKPDVATFSDDEIEGGMKPLRLLHLPFGPVLLTAITNKDDCHSCAGGIGIFYLDQQGSAFTVRKKWPRSVSGWGYGYAPDLVISEKFTTFPAIYANAGYMNQGIGCSSATITELRPEGPVESELIPLSYSNDGASDPDDPDTEALRQVDGKIANIVKGKSFEVRATGTETFTEHYVMRGTKFVRRQKESRLAC